MPAKPKMKYTELSIPNSYLKFVNAVADISLTNIEEIPSYPKINSWNKAFSKAMELVDDFYYRIDSDKHDTFMFYGFMFEIGGEVTFFISHYLNEQFFPFFNTDFYGKIRLNQFCAILEWLEKHPQECREIETWFKYRKRMK